VTEPNPFYAQADDKVEALRAAAYVMADRFDKIACAVGDVEAAERVTEVADVFVAWLREPARLTLTLLRIEEQDNPGTAVPSTPGGSVTTFDTSQQAVYTIDPEDDRGFDVDATLEVTVSDPAVVSAEITPKTATELAKLTVKALAPGSALVTVTDTVSGIFGSDSVDVVTGGVATIELSAPVVEEQVVPTP
jgi:hypothetical protein